ncbi:hypothetical protein FHL15_011045 [Xylaria flabelliformis]|uniref:Uncharacterized protein n=1 Tax=Xylaria flabelliformis TaxID=2512241 RepID=A0A553HJE5_9PEZI|nr:hypothetical protein FHL15_011045 [Xylaria flabelliformis]
MVCQIAKTWSKLSPQRRGEAGKIVGQSDRDEKARFRSTLVQQIRRMFVPLFPQVCALLLSLSSTITTTIIPSHHHTTDTTLAVALSSVRLCSAEW